MITVINYIIEANIGLLFFLAVFRVGLAKESNFALMRFYLLAALITSLSIPLIQIDSASETLIPSASNLIPANWLPEVIINANISQHDVYSPSGWIWTVLVGTYLVGIVFFLSMIVREVFSIIKISRDSKTYIEGSFRILELPSSTSTFSFFNMIFLGNASELSAAEKRHILNHEKVHARQFHSLDIVLVSTIQAIFWFNPFIQFYKRYFVQVHEFEADARAVENSDENKYCSLLAKVALKSADFPIANHFNNSLTLKRITMIRTIKRKINQWRLAAVMAVFPATFFMLAFQDQVAAQVKETLPEHAATNEVFTVVEQMPEFKPNYEAMVEFLSGNMKYPKEAREKKIEGTVHISFIVEKNGALSDVTVLRDLHPACDQEALRVVKLMPAWKPGLQQGKAVRAKMVLPIKFKI